jgi:hypothetical protein
MIFFQNLPLAKVVFFLTIPFAKVDFANWTASYLFFFYLGLITEPAGAPPHLALVDAIQSLFSCTHHLSKTQ